MRILIVGSGGREHALAWHLAGKPVSGQTGENEIYVWPGNAGMNGVATVLEGLSEIKDLIEFVKNNQIDWTVVGPEKFLVSGIVDRFREHDLNIFGPERKAARLESSKDFAKAFLSRQKIPTAGYETFTDFESARDYLYRCKRKVVLKADGLAGGKGVFIPRDLDGAEKKLKELIQDGMLGDAGRKVIIEDFVEGRELSYMIFTDGIHFKALRSARDFKRLRDGDRGPNTGGMGVYSPSPLLTEELDKEIEGQIIFPTLEGLRREGIDYTGVLYIGLFITSRGPLVCEFNVRFGDPETQAVLLALNTPLIEIFEAVKKRSLDRLHIEWDDRVAGGVVLAAPGYPGSYEKGIEIRGLDLIDKNVVVFHAGTESRSCRVFSSGGRVLNVMAMDTHFAGAFKKVYSAIEKIDFPGMIYRKDICPVPLS